MTTDTKTATVAEELRNAAALLRETGAEATAGRWASGDLEERPDFTRRIAITADGDTIAEISLSMEAAAWHFMCNGAKNDAAWIVLTQPALAEPLAAWLEDTADNVDNEVRWHEATVESGDGTHHREGFVHSGSAWCGRWIAVGADHVGCGPWSECHCFDRSLAVARSLLGSAL